MDTALFGSYGVGLVDDAFISSFIVLNSIPSHPLIDSFLIISFLRAQSSIILSSTKSRKNDNSLVPMCWCFSVRSCRVPFSILRQSHVRLFFHPPDKKRKKRRKKFFHRLVKSPPASKAEHPRHSPFTLRSQRFLHSSAFVDKHEQTSKRRWKKARASCLLSSETIQTEINSRKSTSLEMRFVVKAFDLSQGWRRSASWSWLLSRRHFPTFYMPQVFSPTAHPLRKPNKNIFKNAQSTVPSRE